MATLACHRWISSVLVITGLALFITPQTELLGLVHAQFNVFGVRDESAVDEQLLAVRNVDGLSPTRN